MQYNRRFIVKLALVLCLPIFPVLHSYFQKAACCCKPSPALEYLAGTSRPGKPFLAKGADPGRVYSDRRAHELTMP